MLIVACDFLDCTVPTCSDPGLLNGLLRNDWGSAAFVVSDYDAWANLQFTHHQCDNQTCAAAVGINAGMGQSNSDAVHVVQRSMHV
jgi:beta-glucosidase-like glycosyl hydrolase